MSPTDARILVVDDNEDILQAARLLLKRHFAAVQTLDDPTHLATLAKRGSFDVLLLDMNFSPGADNGEEGMARLAEVLEIDPGAVVVHRAVEEGASDIHIEPQSNELVVRLRVDGLLREEQRLPKWTQGAIVSRIKVLANLDIAEKRLPQDGRLVAEIAGRRIDLRVSTLPLTNGEKVVMRVVDSRRSNVQLGDLGMNESDLAKLKRFLARPQGIVLVTGPTGSGKTTLIYAALQSIRDVSRNITTVEDPVEFQIPGLNQVQVDEKAKKTFANALRAILRQDPDVIMIGEIRDRETAQIAFRASVTGHLVLSTVHTNDAASAVTRLIDLGLVRVH